MWIKLAEARRQQHGLVTYRQAVDAGLSPTHITRLLRKGEWTRVRPGVFIEKAQWDGLDVWVAQPALRARAVHLTIGVPHWFSHDSAAALLSMGLLDRGPESVHVTRAELRGRRARAGVVHHGAKVHSQDVTHVEGLPALAMARTALDIVREHGFAVGLGACDHALRSGLSRQDLMDVADRMAGWPFSRLVRDVVEHADGGAENAAESGARALVLELGLGQRPQTQFGLTDGGRTVWCDIRVGRHIVEFDGRVKYVPLAEGGLASNPSQVLWDEKRRQDFVCGFKLGMSRVTYVDLTSGRVAALARLAREYADTESRYGSSISDLAPYTVRRA